MSSIVNCYSCGEPLTSGDSCNACWEDSKDDSLKERVAFLERVAEQARDSFFVTTIPSSDSELCKQTYNGWRFVGRECIFVHGGTGYGIHSEVSDCPDLAAYLREREPQAGEGTVGTVGGHSADCKGCWLCSDDVALKMAQEGDK